jgi:mannose-6-phosphate isomerase-like protein (cupin superfamily)
MTSKSAVAAYALAADDGERLRFGDVEVVIKASADTTGGAFTIFEENEPVDTPVHVHEHEDELFYVLEGEHVFQVGDQEFRAGPGELVFAPRGVPHAQRRVVPRTGRILVLTSPAGFEGFFRELAEADRTGVLGPDSRASASKNYGITWLS